MELHRHRSRLFQPGDRLIFCEPPYRRCFPSGRFENARHRNLNGLYLFCFIWTLSGFSNVCLSEDRPSAEQIRAAVKLSIPLLEKGARGAMEERRQCFTCHNQGLPILALTTARNRGFPIDEDHLQQQLKLTSEFLGRNQDDYKTGKGQGGQIDTAGYALWTLENGGYQPDELTAAVAEYLLLFQKDRNYWRPQSRRPPTEQSYFTSTYLALRALKTFGTKEQSYRIEQKRKQVLAWMLETPAVDTEDQVFRLRGMKIAEAPTAAIQKAVNELMQQQLEDGGWAQLPQLKSDAYATGSVLVALHESGGVSIDSESYQKGLSYLIRNQGSDGSWYVITRSKPIQVYFESGFPHGIDQFISISASSWATTALALALPNQKSPDKP